MAIGIDDIITIIGVGVTAIEGVTAICAVLYAILNSEKSKETISLLMDHAKALLYYEEKSLGVIILNKIRDFFMKLFKIKSPI